MSQEQLVTAVAKATSRRRFLARTAAGALTTTFALLGLQGTAHASTALYSAACCSLCKPNDNNCTPQSCCWCWPCKQRVGSGCQCYSCCECYWYGGGCNGSCSQVKCSHAVPQGACAC
jgi:hypothetical protein